MDWPHDLDGDVLRSLSERGFQFARIVQIDFNVDFTTWPPSSDAMLSIEKVHPEARLSIEDDGRYVLVQICNQLTYEFVIATQAKLTSATKPYGGVCESWGVLDTQTRPQIESGA